ncbi:hypothetical protein IMCC1989_244 [gamma proteobacterium IMCC1989]|nr:hypothetical protein IMCC1989_244 [gamma proteobacterium IMCC1989]
MQPSATNDICTKKQDYSVGFSYSTAVTSLALKAVLKCGASRWQV